MNCLTSSQTIYVVLVFLYSSFILVGCSDLTSKKGNQNITLTNRVDKPIVYNAYDRESSNLIDPLPEFVVKPGQERLISPDGSATISSEDIGGEYRPGNDIRFFVWVVENDTARLRNSITLSNDMLKDAGFRVEIKMGDDGRVTVANVARPDNKMFEFSGVSKQKTSKNKLLEKIKNRPTTEKVFVAKASENIGSLFQESPTVQIPISPDKNIEVKNNKVLQRSNNMSSLSGKTAKGFGKATLVRSDKGVVGSLRNHNNIYEYEPLDNDLHAIIHIDHSKYPPEHSSEDPSGVLSESSKTWVDSSQVIAPSDPQQMSSHAPNGGATIGVLVAYTSAAESAHGDIEGLAQSAIDVTTNSYANSNMSLNLYLAEAAEVNYNESGSTHDDHLANMADPNDGELDNLQSLRNQHTADVVILLVDDNDNETLCGKAQTILASEGTANAVVHYNCATSNLSLAHEVGHLQGARHDLQADSNTSPFVYGHGYIDPNDDFRTIMATSDLSVTRVQYWSNPDVNYPPTGQPMGTAADEDNARALGNTAFDVRDFRTLPPPANFDITNPYSSGSNPSLTWNSVSGADDYHIYRCTHTGSYSSWCYDEIYSVGSSQTNWDDYSFTITQDSPYDPCNDEFGVYYVTAQNFTGESDFFVEKDVCGNAAF